MAGQPTHLHAHCGCFHSKTADLSSCNRGHRDHKARNIYYLTLYLKSLLTSDLEEKTGGKLKIMTALVITIFEKSHYVFEGECHGAKYSL